MISWIQRTFQKHTKLIFVFLLLVIAIPFVFTIGASPGIGKAGHKRLEKPFFGYNLGSVEDQQRIFGDAELSIFLQAGFMALNGAQLEEYALQRVAALHLADAHGLPAPSQQQLTDHLAKLGLFQNAERQFDAKRYADFVDSLKNNPRLTRADLARVLADDVRLIQVQEILSGPGYVMPAEVHSQLERGGTEWTISVATASLDAFTAEVPINELTLSAWFDQNAARYQRPARVAVDYVVFKPADHAAGVTFTEADLLAYYKANPSRFPGSAEDAAAGSDTIPLALRGTVEGSLRNELASKRAARVASDFALALVDRKIVRGSVGLDDLIASFNLTRQSAPLFSAAEPPKELGWPATVAEAAFRLSDRRFFSDPLPLADGSSVILFWKETVPPSTPSLAEVRDAVVRDFTAMERRRLFVEAGGRWRADLQSRIAGGSTLEAAASAMVDPKLQVMSYPPFTRQKPPENIEQAVLAALEGTAVGQLSGFIPTGDKGLLVHVISRKAPVIDENSPEYAATRTQLARLSASLEHNMILAALVERELGKTAEVDVGP